MEERERQTCEQKEATDLLAKSFKRPEHNVCCHGLPFQTRRTSGAAGCESAARGINTLEQSLVE
jgi:hypothetical protein